MTRSVWPRVTAIVFTVFGAACLQTITAGPGEPTEAYTFSVTVTNDGDGSGRVTVDFSEGSPQDRCASALGPGESCEPFVRTTEPVATAEIRATAEPGSDFVGWSGPTCTGTSAECVVTNTSTEFDASEEVRPIFRLAGGP